VEGKEGKKGSERSRREVAVSPLPVRWTPLTPRLIQNSTF
jgi:hypothetical protein